MTAEQLFFFVFAIGAIAGAAGVLLFRNPVNSALSLVVSFFFLSFEYVLLRAHFMAVLQILVYAGAIMVLFIFVLMLLNLHPDELGNPRVTVTKLVGAVVSAGLFVTLVATVLSSQEGSRQVWLDSFETEFGSMRPIARELMTTYVLPFEMVSVLLLVGIVGAVVVAKKRL